MSQVYRYRIWCSTDSKYEYVWNTTEPTVCPTNSAHTISDVTIVDTVSTDIKQVTETTDGLYYLCETQKFTIPAGTGVSYHTHSWPHDILIWKTEYHSQANQIGDSFNVSISPNTTIGVIAAPATAGDTVLTVSPTVLIYAQKGFFVTLYDTGASPPILHNAGRCLNIDSENSQITIENALTSNMNPGVTLINITVYLLRGIEIDLDNRNIDFADKGIRGKILPANTTMQLEYTNNNGLAKSFNLHTQFYYGNNLSE